jgi:SAM-dependent methyltransferase/uncharacterized protein YbaR (Trm112 family)
MDGWPTSLFACPSTGPSGALRQRPDVGWFCDDSRLAYPVLGGCPILVPDPARWVAEHRDALLATLAAHGLADERTIAVIDALAEPWLDSAPEPFRDDWTAGERRGDGRAPEPVAGPAAAMMAELLCIDEDEGVSARIRSEVSSRAPATIVEIGPGAGLLAAHLSRGCERLALVDRSLRSVLLSLERARAAGRAQVCGVVAEADSLCLRPGSVDLVVAANLLDLLVEPEDFVARAAEGLRSGGALVTCTPHPSLRQGDPESSLVEAIEDAGLTIETIADGLPWIRPHSPREYQVFLCQLIVAERG